MKRRFEDPIKGEETRRKMSEAQKKHYEDPIKGEEYRRKMSEAYKVASTRIRRNSQETERGIKETILKIRLKVKNLARNIVRQSGNGLKTRLKEKKLAGK